MIRTTQIYQEKKAPKRRKIPHGVDKKRIFWRKFGKVVKALIISLSICGFVLAFYEIVLNSGTFRVSKIEISGTNTFVNETDLENLVHGKVSGKHIASLNTEIVQNLLKDNFLGAKNITVTKKLPNTVVVTVQERVPLAVVKSEKGNDYFMVDEDGYVLGLVNAETTNLPKIAYEGELYVGYFIDKDLIPLYLGLLTNLDSEKIPASSVSVSDRYVSFYIAGPTQVFVGKDKDIMSSIKLLAELVKQLGLEGKDVRKIDLRYDKVIVQY